MPKHKIHYQHPTLNYHACGMGDAALIEMTDDIDKVTCQRCLGTVTGKKRSNRQQGDEPKQERKIKIAAELVRMWDDRALRDGKTKTEIIEAALRQYLSIT